jgi:hypothetical protein
MDEIKFLSKILEFYNFNVCLGKRDLKSRIRLNLLMNIIPSFKQLRGVLKHFPPDNKVSKVMYKTVGSCNL